MKLDPFSPTLITDWVRHVTGETLTEVDQQKFKQMLASVDLAQARSRPYLVDLEIPGTLILGLPNESGKSITYCVSVRRGPFFIAGRQFSNVSRRETKARIETAIKTHKDGSDMVVEFPWRNSERFGGEPIRAHLNAQVGQFASQIRGRVISVLRDHLKRRFKDDSKALTRQPGYRRLTEDAQKEMHTGLAARYQENLERVLAKTRREFPVLKMAIRQRWRAPEVKTMRLMTRRLDRKALATMRNVHNFSPLYYGWLVQNPENEIRQRREVFSRRFPMLVPFAYAFRATSEYLTAAIDSGQAFEGSRGMRQLGSIIAERVGHPLTLETVFRLASFRAVDIPPAQAKLTLVTLPYLNQIAATNWPPSIAALQAFQNVMATMSNNPSLFAQARERFVSAADGGWENFAEKFMGDPELRQALPSLPAYAEDMVSGVILPARFVHSGTIPELTNLVRRDLQARFLGSAPLLEMLDANRIWHQPTMRLNQSHALMALGESDQSFMDRVPSNWLPLIRPHTIAHGFHYKNHPIGGLKVVELTSETEIRAQGQSLGRDLKECTERCLLPPSQNNAYTHHLICVEGAKGQRSLFQVTAGNRNDHKRYLIEIAGSTESKPPANHVAAVQSIINGLQLGRVSEANSFGMRRERLERMSETAFERGIGCDIRQPVVGQRYFGLWRPFLPLSWVQSSEHTPATELKRLLPGTTALSWMPSI